MVKCAVVACTNKSQIKVAGISFHKFPKNQNLRQKWLNSINRPNFKPSRCSCICSDHFKKDEINLTLCFPRLKDNACPSILESKMSRQSQRKFEMRCCVPLCKNDADTIPKNSDISFHMFPESTELRKFWLEALDLTDWFEKDVNTAINSVVCSEHFSSADIYSTKSGFRKLRIGAVPLVIQESLDDDTLAEVPEQLKICRICLDTDCKMFSMNQYKLEEVYQNMTGFSMGEDERVSQTFCVECAHRLVTFDKFREKSLQADLLLSELLKKTKSVLFQSLKEEVMKIDRKNFGLTSNLGEKLLSYDAFDLYIQEDTQIEPNIECETYDDQDNISKKENYTVYFDKSDANVQTEGTPTKNIKQNTPNVSVGAKQQATSKSNASQTPNTTAKSIVHQTTTKTNKSNVLTQMTTKNETHTVSTPKTKNTQIKQLQPIVNRNVKPYQPIHTPQKNMKTYKNVKRLAEIENPVVVKQEVVTENNESMQVDYIPVIDVVIDNKFKIVRKEDLLLKNAQLVIANKQTPNKDGDGNRAIVNDNHNTPVGNNPNLNNSVVKEKKVLPIMKGDRIIMPNENKDNEENQTEMPILQTILTQKASKTQENADKSKSVEIEIPDINDDGNNTSDTYEVPVTGYVEQEYYEESIVETVNSDYLDLHSEDDELLNIKREVEQIVKEERDMTGVSDIKEDPELWDEDNNEDNEDNEPVDDSWGQDDFSEEENEEEENSEDGENGGNGKLQSSEEAQP
ncbi:protein PFC0760c-like isoform X2 [Bicyclus anynana]|uniref:Protein PFC0760c-like isoform X2 n=1 Tax=Bicyclus anynana TaxID=110368 RepID=A0ABM3M4A5_BICAN|nr:protein PFC0760c-like isoform X2 [Bicyclus anynana]